MPHERRHWRLAGPTASATGCRVCLLSPPCAVSAPNTPHSHGPAAGCLRPKRALSSAVTVKNSGPPRAAWTLSIIILKTQDHVGRTSQGSSGPAHGRGHARRLADMTAHLSVRRQEDRPPTSQAYVLTCWLAGWPAFGPGPGPGPVQRADAHARCHVVNRRPHMEICHAPLMHGRWRNPPPRPTDGGARQVPQNSKGNGGVQTRVEERRAASRPAPAARCAWARLVGDANEPGRLRLGLAIL